MDKRNRFDKVFEKTTGALADRTSRRGFLGSLGRLMVGGMLVPLLPVFRYSEAQAAESPSLGDDWNNPQSCDYWAYCGVDGVLCSCCGGTSANCPPGTQPSPIAWVGTCRNPDDGKIYVISYNDCCGAANCGRCYCNRNEGETPKYRPEKSNAVTWCYGGVAPTYHCTVSRIVALADD